MMRVTRKESFCGGLSYRLNDDICSSILISEAMPVGPVLIQSYDYKKLWCRISYITGDVEQDCTFRNSTKNHRFSSYMLAMVRKGFRTAYRKEFYTLSGIKFSNVIDNRLTL